MPHDEVEDASVQHLSEQKSRQEEEKARGHR